MIEFIEPFAHRNVGFVDSVWTYSRPKPAKLNAMSAEIKWYSQDLCL